MPAATDQPAPLRGRLRRKRLGKIAAAIAVVTITLLAACGGDDDDEPTVAAPVSTATTLASPAAEATAAVAVTATTDTVTATATVDTVAATKEASKTAVSAERTATAAASATVYAALPVPGEIVAEIPVGSRPFGIAATDNAIWVAIADEGTVVRIDPATNAVVATVQVGPAGSDSHAHPSDLVAYDGQVWTINNVDGTLVRIDPATNQVAQEIEVSPAAGSDALTPYFMLVDETGIWVTDFEAGRLLHIDPATGAVLASLDLPRPGWMASGFGSIWVNMNQDTTDGMLVRVDPVTHAIISEFSFASVEPLRAPAYVAIGAGTVWVSDFSSGTVIRIDPTTNTVVAVIDSGFDSGADMAVTENGAWIVASIGDLGVVRIDLETNQPSQSLPSRTGWYLVDLNGSIWIAATRDDLVVRIDAAP